jgi:hypothetical protein
LLATKRPGAEDNLAQGPEEHPIFRGVVPADQSMEAAMGLGRGALLWLLGIPLPIIIILALFMHH